MPKSVEREHIYHAEATALTGRLHRPLEQEIRPQAFVKLLDHGGYLGHHTPEYRMESVIRYSAAHTQVSGHHETKKRIGDRNTLATAVVEGLNVLEVVTADRVVAQVATVHPLDGHVPSVTFLGTRFENLRIAGYEVKLDMDLDLFGEKPENDASYTRSPGFISRISKQHAHIRKLHKEYKTPLDKLLARFKLLPDSFKNSSSDEEAVECSLVNQCSLVRQGENPYLPGHAFGHVIHVPHFGTVYLATLRLRHSNFLEEKRTPTLTSFELTMIDIQMGCITSGNTSIAVARTNGLPGG